MSEPSSEKKETEKIRLPYTPPQIESEEVFEARALACGKCRRSSEARRACATLSANS